MLCFFFNGARKRGYKHYQEERVQLESLSDDELNYKYVEVKAKYEHKKNIFSFLIVVVLLAGLADIGKCFLKQSLVYISNFCLLKR